MQNKHIIITSSKTQTMKFSAILVLSAIVSVGMSQDDDNDDINLVANKEAETSPSAKPTTTTVKSTTSKNSKSTVKTLNNSTVFENGTTSSESGDKTNSHSDNSGLQRVEISDDAPFVSNAVCDIKYGNWQHDNKTVPTDVEKRIARVYHHRASGRLVFTNVIRADNETVFECLGGSSAKSIQLVVKPVDATKCLNEGSFADNSQSQSIFMNQTCHCQYGSYGRWCENQHDSDVWVTVLVAVFVVFAGVVVLFLGYRRQVLPIRQNNKPIPLWQRIADGGIVKPTPVAGASVTGIVPVAAPVAASGAPVAAALLPSREVVPEGPKKDDAKIVTVMSQVKPTS